VEEENAFTLSQGGAELGIPQLISPIEGIITSGFDKATNHFAVDIAAASNTPVKTCYEGTVIFADWTSETGNIIIVQHENNLLSAYKHNSALLKEVGEFVRSGEAIAIIGNSGENSTGPHLHFELWFEGSAYRPAELYKILKTAFVTSIGGKVGLFARLNRKRVTTLVLRMIIVPFYPLKCRVILV
jgi:murein DD-endopeptidase MepM/ murein hydrolase activator NlpD